MNEPLVTTESPAKVKSPRRSNHFHSNAVVLHLNGGLPLKTELAERYPNMPRRERRRLARLITEMELKKEKV